MRITRQGAAYPRLNAAIFTVEAYHVACFDFSSMLYKRSISPTELRQYFSSTERYVSAHGSRIAAVYAHVVLQHVVEIYDLHVCLCE